MELYRTVLGIEPGMRALVSAPLYHSAPNLYGMQALLAGELLAVEPRFDAEATLALIERHRLTNLYLVPTMYVRLLKLAPEVRRRYDIASVRFISSTGSPCASEVKRAMIDWFGPVITETYASSETGHITFIDSHAWLKRPGSVGRALGEGVVKILDDDGRELPPGKIGLIYCRQPAYPDFTYTNDRAARDAIERDGLWSVGDMGYLDADGYLYIADRKSDMVISGGVNIYPAEIEAVLMTLPAIADCAVFGIPDAEFGEALAAAVQLRPDQKSSEKEVQDFLRERIANYKVPRAVTFHDALPREDSGKIFKRLLREPYWAKAGRRI
jgi:long-chain acyl-CoA synthetase